MKLQPYLDPHFCHHGGTPPAAFWVLGLELLVMLGMLAGHAGDVENDADDVDGLVACLASKHTSRPLNGHGLRILVVGQVVGQSNHLLTLPEFSFGL